MSKATKISIDLDLTVVQDAIHAKVEPVVTDILKKYDLKKLIAAELTRKRPKADSHYGLIPYYMAAMGGGADHPQTLMEELIRSAVNDAAKAYIKKAVDAQSPKIEAAFRKMLKGSPDKLARTLLASLSGALENNWTFELNTRLTPKEPDRDYND